MRWIIRGWPGPSADGLGPRLALNTARPSTDPRLAPNKAKESPETHTLEEQQTLEASGTTDSAIGNQDRTDVR